MPTIILLAAILASAASGTIAAQDTVRLEPGQRVRVTAPTISRAPIVGVGHMEADTLVVETDGRTLHFARASLTRVDVNHGQKSNVGKGALFGFLIGAGVGAVALGSNDYCTLEVSPAAGSCALIGAGVGGVGGLLVGTVAGALIKTDRWRELPLDRLRVSFIHARLRPFAVAMSVSF